jgi:peptidoglycan hydrolase-like protein with peptidoglycan-binding domain
VLMEGAVGPAVEALQRALRDAGFSPGEIDGEFGPNTRNAIAVFQLSRGLPATGVADERTLSLLNIAAPTPIPAIIGRQDVQRREREQFLERLVAQLVNTSRREEASSRDNSATDVLSKLLRQALVAAPNGQAAGENAGADAVLRRVLQAALQGTGVKPAADGAIPSSDEIAKVLPLSPIDKALGGEALVGLKTPTAIGAYAALSIFQTLGIAGPVTATATQPPSTTSQVLLTLIGAFGALGGLSKVDRAVRALSVIATKR